MNQIEPYTIERTTMKTLILLITLIVIPCSSHAATVNYSYDLVGRLTKATYSNGSEIRYTYDAAGNIISRSTTKGIEQETRAQSVSSNQMRTDVRAVVAMTQELINHLKQTRTAFVLKQHFFSKLPVHILTEALVKGKKAIWTNSKINLVNPIRPSAT